MTGGGFGGSAVALVRASAARDFVREVESSYRSTTVTRNLFVCRAVSGVISGRFAS
jgi:galactokinase